jgi:glycolate oxidase iron-sulfur subunit
MTTCPSGVNYMHLVDHARAYIEKTYRRPFIDRLTRRLLAMVLPYPARFRAALSLAGLGRPFAGLFRRIGPLKPLGAAGARSRHQRCGDPASDAARHRGGGR